MFATSRFLDEGAYRLLRLADGRDFYVPRTLFQPQRDGSYYLPLQLEELAQYNQPSTPHDPQTPEASADLDQETIQVIPEIEEQLQVGKRIVETGKVRVHKTVTSAEAVVDEALFSETYDIDRVTVNRIVSEIVGPRYEEATLVLSTFEEVLVVEKRLILREEIRLTPKRTERREPQTHTVRREHVEIDRTAQGEDSDEDTGRNNRSRNVR